MENCSSRKVQTSLHLRQHPFESLHAISSRLLQIHVPERVHDRREHLRDVRGSERHYEEHLRVGTVLRPEGSRVLLHALEDGQLVRQAELAERGLALVLGRQRAAQPRVDDCLHPAHALHVPF